MQVQRFLGSAWATVHGPVDPRRLLITILESGFAGLAAAPGPRAVDWSRVREAADDLPFAFAAVHAADPLAERSPLRGLCSASPGERQVARGAIGDAVRCAHTLGCNRIVLDLGVVAVVGEIEAEDLAEPGYQWSHERAQALLARRRVGRNGAVERACRELFEILKSWPDVHFCLTLGRSVRSVLDLAAMRDILGDLPLRRLGYWHDAGLAARREQVLGEAQGEWLESFGNLLQGMSLGDGSPDGVYLPPGSGGVDYGLCSTYVPRSSNSFPVVLQLDPSVAPGEMAGMRSCLDKYGL